MGLSEKTRKWYYQQILKILQKYKRTDINTIVYELRKLPQGKYPLTTRRVVAFLKEMRALGLIKCSKEKHHALHTWEI